jgi:hypothetical protein
VGNEKYVQSFSREALINEFIGRPRYRWEDNIKLDLRELWFQNGNCVHLTQDMVQWQSPVNIKININIWFP